MSDIMDLFDKVKIPSWIDETDENWKDVSSKSGKTHWSSLAGISLEHSLVENKTVSVESSYVQIQHSFVDEDSQKRKPMVMKHKNHSTSFRLWVGNAVLPRNDTRLSLVSLPHLLSTIRKRQTGGRQRGPGKARTELVPVIQPQTDAKMSQYIYRERLSRSFMEEMQV